ncbi:conserved Plasmodium protein, unknown function [Plasmodium ovale wallikeri]|uniref:Uncharacterized protein n=1 Tax=Plasmodium ovale wallikeri TaxID=864142 RepID=A0A1A8ZDR8_PLAOA|nr:conserved Plasmodium protein, unknown function [Plasmodium ovale wallikeri]
MASRQKEKVKSEAIKTSKLGEKIACSIEGTHKDKIRLVSCEEGNVDDKNGKSVNKTVNNSEKDVLLSLKNREISSKDRVLNDTVEEDFFNNNTKHSLKTKFKNFSLNENLVEYKNKCIDKSNEKILANSTIKEKFLRKYNILPNNKSLCNIPEKVSINNSEMEDKALGERRNHNDFPCSDQNLISPVVVQRNSSYKVSTEKAHRNSKEGIKLCHSKYFKELNKKKYKGIARLESTSTNADNYKEPLQQSENFHYALNKSMHATNAVETKYTDRKKNADCGSMHTDSHMSNNRRTMEKEEKVANSSSYAESIIRCNDEQLKRSIHKSEWKNKISKMDKSSHKYHEKECFKYHRNYYSINSDNIKNIINNNVRNDRKHGNGGISNECANVERKDSIITQDGSSKNSGMCNDANGDTLSYANDDTRSDPNGDMSSYQSSSRDTYNDITSCARGGTTGGVSSDISNDINSGISTDINNDTSGDGYGDLNGRSGNSVKGEASIKQSSRGDVSDTVEKKENFSDGGWIEIEQPFNFWDALKNNFKNVFLINSEETDLNNEEKVEMDQHGNNEEQNINCSDEKSKGDDEKSKCDDEKSKCDDEKSKCDDEKSKCNDEKSMCNDEKSKCNDEKSMCNDEKSKCNDEQSKQGMEKLGERHAGVTKAGDTKDRGSRGFPLSRDIYVKCLNFLSAEKILECELLNKLTSDVINNRVNVFTYIKKLYLDEKWSNLPIYKRQYYLHQMKHLKHINTSEKIYSGNGMYIHEVAAIIFQNVSNLKTLELLSPEYVMNDNTPRHEPFALCPSVFKKLEKLTIIGCQTLEWLHIFRNCSFPLLKKFEVCYYPLHHDHWVWKFIFDFTVLGLQGLYKMLYTMENLLKLTIGFDVLFDNVEGYIYNPIESHRNTLDEFNLINHNQRFSNSISVPPANGYPSRKYKSYRGRLCEEDFSDIFTIAYYIIEKRKKLMRIMIKYRDSYDPYDDDIDNDEMLNEFISEATNTASTYYNYVLNWFRSSDETATRAE